ncbi:MAG TPA: SprB repeat-containing protein, partial [Anditalea sp.]|nr:SprB repeat-containing protein [Anditalea sp.]
MENIYSKFFINFLVSAIIIVLTGTSVYSHLNTATPVQDIPLQVDHMAFTQCARTAELRVRGGLPPYRYVWLKDGVEVKVDNISDGSMSILTMAQAGNYTVNVFDNSSPTQQLSQTFNFVDSRNFQFDLSFGKDYLCEGKSYGKVVGQILGGAAPFTFNFYESVQEAPKFSAFSATRQVDIREIPSGNYTVEIIDNSGCKEIVEVTLEEIMPFTFQAIEVLSEDCEANGEFTYQVNGFSGEVQYKIIRISDNEIIRDWAVAPNGLIKQDKLFNGIYEVHVIDANRKKECPEKFSVTIPDHRRIIVTAWTKPVTCFGGNDGVIYLEILRINLGLGGTSQNVDVYHTPPGGTRSRKNTVGLGNPLKVEVYENAVGGLHKFEVEQGGTRNSECVLTLFVEVNMPPGPIAASSTATTPVSCFGGADGTATVEVTGGWGGYTYQWNDPLQQKTKTAKNLRAGTYEVTVTDKQGCARKFPVTVVGPPGQITATFSTDPATCVGTADGSATVTATGGWGAPFTYLWSNGQEGQTVTNLPPGENFVLITDKNGCTREFPFNVPIAEEPGVAITEQAPTCFGSNNGVIKVNIDNPTHNYIVKAAGVTKSGAEVLFTDLAPGTYEVIISYGNGCEIIKWATVPDVPKLELDNSETIRNDILCFGQETGSITGIKILGGNGGNQIVWQKLVDSNFVTIPGQTNIDLFNVGAGSYRLNVTDAKGCFQQHVYILNQPGEFKLLDRTIGDVSCFGRKDGSIALAISGGVAPYTYSYNGGPEQTTANVLISLTNLAAGTGNTLLVRDANNCQLPAVIFDIKQPQEILIEQLSLQKETCFNTKDASIKLEISGGSGNLDIRWTRRGSSSTIATTKELNNIGPGEYVVTVKDLNNPTCEVVREYIIPVTPELLVTPSVTNILCFGDPTGAINLSITGGTLNPGDIYTVQWTGPNGYTSTAASISDLLPGTYSVTVKDSNNCETTSANIEVRQPIAPVTVELINAVNPSCHNGTNGRIEISVGGGTGLKSISWAKWNGSEYINVPGTNTTLAGLSPGRYMATAIDQNGCPKEIEATLINPQPIAITILEKLDPTCFGVNDGSIKIDVVGGSGAPYNFSWSHGSSRQNPTNLGGGVYTVTVRDAFGCEVASEPITLVEPAQLGIQLVEIRDPECFGSPSHIEVNLLGGVESQRKTKWTNLTTNEVIVDSYGVNRIDGLTPGFYELRYSNNGFCELTRIYQVRGPAEKLELIIDTTPNECGVESISLFANGGIPAYRFRYLRDGEWVPINASLLAGLGGGQHTFKVMDSKNCEDEKTITLTNQAPAFVQADKVRDVTCFGSEDGIISYVISGATNYSWYKLVGAVWEVLPGYDFKLTQNGPQNLEDLTDGIYKLRVYYNNSESCFEDSGDILIIEPKKLEIASSSNVQPVCWDDLGSFSLSVRGGNNNKRIVLNKPDNTIEVIEDINNNTQYTFGNLLGGEYSYAIEDEHCAPILGSFTINSVQRPMVQGIEINDVSCFGANDGTFIMLSPTVAAGRDFYVFINGEKQAKNKVDFGPFAPGRYSVRMEDSSDCESEEYSVEIAEPNRPLEITQFQKQDITCFGAGNGRATFQIIGGRETYSAVLTKVGDASFVVTKTGINETTEVSFENLEVGNYRIEVKDQQDRCQTDITFTITTPDLFTATENHGTIDCFGGTTSISVNLSGGVAPFNVKYFSLGEGGAKFEVFSHTINGNRSIFNNVGPGTYLYEVRDSNGCLISSEEDIVINDGQELLFTSTKVDEKCYNGFDGSITIIASGSNGNDYIYYVNNRAYSSNVITGLGRGTYTVYVMNGDGCISPSETITIDGPAKALAFTQYSQTNLSCFESTDGKITLRLTGGTAPYNVMFDGQSYQLEEDVTKIFENLTAEKQYNFQVTDANGCTLELFPRTLTQPDPLLVADRFQPILCYGGTTEIQLSVTGGTSPFVVAWNYSQDGVTFSPLTETGRTLVSAYAGHYQYTLTDAKGCTFSNTIVVPQPELLDFTFDVVDVTCFRGEDGSIEFFPEGGLSGDYRLFVNNKEVVAIDNKFVLNDLKFGNYTAYFTRGNCISETKTIRVNQPLAGISVNLLYQEDVNCFEGVTDVVFNIQGGNGIYTAYLNNREITLEENQIIFSDVRAGNYTLRVVDQKGCDWTGQITITEPQPIKVTNAAIKTVTCFEGGDGEIQLTVAGGTGVIRYEWTDLSSGDVIGFNDNLKNLAIGNYRVRIYDDRGCEIIEEYEVEGVEAITFEAETVDVLCFGGNNGVISVKNITGGRGNFRLVIDGIVRDGLTVSNLTAKAGYEVMLIDGSGCMSEIITVDINQPVALAVQSVATPETCYNANNGTITLTIQGGVGPYIVRWGDQQLGATRTGLFPGVYQYVVTDMNGCTFSGSARVDRADPLQLDAEVTPVLCHGESTGKVTLQIIGGTGTYTYAWRKAGSDEVVATTKDLLNKAAGDYRVTITDSNNCTISRNFTINQPSQPLTVEGLAVDIRCFGEENGEIRLSLQGGTGFRTVRWHDDNTDARIRSGLKEGSYTVTVTDENGCSDTKTFTITEPDPIQVTTLAIDNVSCKGGNDGSASINIVGGAGGYIVQWVHNGSNLLTQEGLSAGTYAVLVSDRNF